MTIVSMFVRRDDADEVGLVYSAGLAAKMAVPLKAVCALPDAANVYAYSTPEFALGVSTVVSKEIIEAQDNLVKSSRQAFDRIIVSAGLDHDTALFEHRTGLPGQIAGEEALLADVIIFPRAAAKAGHGLSGACEHVLMSSALPVVIAGSSPRVDGPAIIAWDGSEQAARSVRLNLPLLRSADRVIIAQNTKTLKGRFRGDAHSQVALQAWLKGHSLASDLSSIEGHVGHGLLDLANSVQATVIVAGAYGHSRAGEYLFGGVTRTLMHAEKAPALALCH